MIFDVIFSIGSNCGDRYGRVSQAIEILSGLLTQSSVSSIYETPDAHGGESRYLNAVVGGKCRLSQSECECFCKEMERKAGRDDIARSRGEVPLDVDVVVWDGDVKRERDFRQSFFTIGLAEILNESCPS